MEGKETKGKETQLAGKSSQKVDKILKGGKMTKSTAKTEEKFLTAKDLAKMANVKPGQSRRCLRTHFAGRISTTKGDNGLKVYKIKADDPIVKEIVAKLKGNGGKATTPVKAKAPKLTKEGKKQAKVKAKQEAALARLPAEEKEPVITDKGELIMAPKEQTDKGEGDEPSPESFKIGDRVRFDWGGEKEDIITGITEGHRKDGTPETYFLLGEAKEIGLPASELQKIENRLTVPEPLKRALVKQGKETK